jgi:hypothetical protein
VTHSSAVRFIVRSLECNKKKINDVPARYPTVEDGHIANAYSGRTNEELITKVFVDNGKTY